MPRLAVWWWRHPSLPHNHSVDVEVQETTPSFWLLTSLASEPILTDPTQTQLPFCKTEHVGST